MARASQRRKTVRKDPPATMLDPSQQFLQLVDSKGKDLRMDGEYGMTDGRYTYTWVDATNQQQYINYQARMFQPTRYSDNCARPKFKTFNTAGEEEGGDALVQRNELVLMRRRVEDSKALVDEQRATSDSRLEMMGRLEDAEKRRAAHAAMKLREVDYQRVDED